MRIQKAGGSVSRLVSIWRDSRPLPGERAPSAIQIDAYAFRRGPKTVASIPILETPRLQQYVVDSTPEGDQLLAALASGPIKVGMRPGSWTVDLDRIERAR